MSGILLAFFNVAGGSVPPITVAADGSFSGAPLADVSFGG
jgi:hypothetical protein